jgi:hypothetical protein
MILIWPYSYSIHGGYKPNYSVCGAHIVPSSSVAHPRCQADFNKVVLEFVREKYRSKMANCLVAIIYLLVGWSKPVYSRCM